MHNPSSCIVRINALHVPSGEQAIAIGETCDETIQGLIASIARFQADIGTDGICDLRQGVAFAVKVRHEYQRNEPFDMASDNWKLHIV